MTNGNEPAFSKAAFYHPEAGIDGSQEGLTKREYFAAMAMQALITKSASSLYYKDSAIEAVQIADELIKSLNK